MDMLFAYVFIGEILSSHGGEDLRRGLLGCDSV